MTLRVTSYEIWAYPYAKTFWFVVALAVVTSFGLHLARLRQIRSLWRSPS